MGEKHTTLRTVAWVCSWHVKNIDFEVVLMDETLWTKPATASLVFLVCVSHMTEKKRILTQIHMKDVQFRNGIHVNCKTEFNVVPK